MIRLSAPRFSFMAIWRILLEITRRALYFSALGALQGIAKGALIGAVLGMELMAIAGVAHVLPRGSNMTGVPLGLWEYLFLMLVGAIGGFGYGALLGAATWAAVFFWFAAFQPAARNYKAHAAFTNAVTRATEAGIVCCMVGALVGAMSLSGWALVATSSLNPGLPTRGIPPWPEAPLWAIGYYYGAIAGFALGGALGAGYPGTVERIGTNVKAMFAPMPGT